MAKLYRLLLPFQVSRILFLQERHKAKQRESSFSSYSMIQFWSVCLELGICVGCNSMPLNQKGF